MGIFRLPKEFHPDFSVPNRKPVDRVEIDRGSRYSRFVSDVFLMRQDLNGVSGTAGTVVNASWESGSGLICNGTSTIGTLPPSPGYVLGTSDFTIYAKVNYVGTGGSQHNGIVGVNYGGSNGWALYIFDAVSNSVRFRSGDGAIYAQGGTNSCPVGRRELYVTRINGVVRLYVDWVEVANDTSSTKNLSDTSNLTIGHRDASNYFQGTIYDVHILKGRGIEPQSYRHNIYQNLAPRVPLFYKTASAGTDALAANDIESASEVSTPTIAQTHNLVATSVESSSNVTAPVIVQEHAITTVSVESASELSSPALAEGQHSLLADDVESSSEVTNPVMGQVHIVTAASVESASAVDAPSITQEHAILADSVESGSELTTPGLSESTDALTADDVESQSEITAPGVGQVHGLTVVSLESASEASSPALLEATDALSADDIESASELTTPTIAQIHAISANDTESNTEVSTPTLSIIVGLAANDVESASDVSTPAIAEVHALFVTSIESASDTTTATLGQVHNILADDIESASQVSLPSAGNVGELTVVGLEYTTPNNRIHYRFR